MGKQRFQHTAARPSLAAHASLPCHLRQLCAPKYKEEALTHEKSNALQVSPVIRFTSAGQPVGVRRHGARRKSECHRSQTALKQVMQHSAAVAGPSASDTGWGSCCRYEMGRQSANTKLSSNVAVRKVRVRGGNQKFRALRLDHGNYSWGSEVGCCCCLLSYSFQS